MGHKIKNGLCELCGRQKGLTFHHLIPRTLHKNKWFKKNFTKDDMQSGINVCQECHSELHKFISEKELGKVYNTKNELLKHEKLSVFIQWVSKR